MQVAPLPSDEQDRLQALKDLGVLDTPSEKEFDALVEAAALVCEAPISLVSLVDTDRQWFKANQGLPEASLYKWGAQGAITRSILKRSDLS